MIAGSQWEMSKVDTVSRNKDTTINFKTWSLLLENKHEKHQKWQPLGRYSDHEIWHSNQDTLE